MFHYIVEYILIWKLEGEAKQLSFDCLSQFLILQKANTVWSMNPMLNWITPEYPRIIFQYLFYNTVCTTNNVNEPSKHSKFPSLFNSLFSYFLLQVYLGSWRENNIQIFIQWSVL